ncbi:MAG TPA: pilin [Candidatus Doudnabacteria bacterium]|nr:pilin [Candidatus Doudnabacteria bacterium]
MKQTLTNLTWDKVALALLAFAIAFMPVVAILPTVTNAQSTPIDNCPPGFRCGGEQTIGQLFFVVTSWALGIAFFVAVIILIVGGFRYMLAGGNEESASAGRKTIFNALIGLIIIVLSFVIVQIAYRFVSGTGGGGPFGGT